MKETLKMWFTDLRRPECNFLDLSRCATFGGNPTLLIVPTVKHDDCSIMLSNIFGLSVAFLTNVLITWSNFQTVSPRHSHGYAIFFPLKKKKDLKMLHRMIKVWDIYIQPCLIFFKYFVSDLLWWFTWYLWCCLLGLFFNQPGSDIVILRSHNTNCTYRRSPFN